MNQVNSTRNVAFALLVLSSLILTGVAGCNDDSDSKTPAVGSGGSSATGGSTGQGGTSAEGGAAGAADCFTNPKTHFEIINACTDAVRVQKSPKLPALPK